MEGERLNREKQTNHAAPEKKPLSEALEHQPPTQAAALTSLQQQVGNRAVQRMLAQRSGEGAAELDDETAERINRGRSGGQPLAENLQQQMGAAFGQDFSGVRVHTGGEANDLNQDLNAKAFTTGADIFFREGAYQPESSGGQALISHELTHVVQQSTGMAGSAGAGMTVNAPGDAYEQQAESVSKSISGAMQSGGLQRAANEEEEDENKIQRQEMDEDEDELQGRKK